MPDMAALNQQLLKWCEQERERHLHQWERERPKLRPLPSHPFRCSVTRMVKVNKYSLVNYDRIRYSVPCHLVKQTLRLEAFADRIEVWEHNKLVTTHRRSYVRGETVLDLNHYLDILERKPRAVMHAAVVRRLPEIYSKARALLIQQEPDSYKELCHILLLHRSFPGTSCFSLGNGNRDELFNCFNRTATHYQPTSRTSIPGRGSGPFSGALSAHC